MKNNSALLVVIAAGIALAAYAMQSQASVADQSGGDVLPPDSGDGGSWWDWSSVGISPDTATPTVAIDAPPDPGIDFGILSDIGAFMGNWKTGEYPKYASAIRDAEQRHGIPTDLLARLLYQESRYRADVIAGYKRSPVGALGIAQFMPATAAEYGLTLVPFTYQGNATQTYDPFASINAAGRYLRVLYNQFGDWRTALTAYNWGPGNVVKWQRDVDARIVPQETRNYVAQITADVPVA